VVLLVTNTAAKNEPHGPIRRDRLVKSSAARALDGAVLTLLLLTLFWAPLPLGSDALWAQGLLFVLVTAAVILWLAAGVVRGALYVPRTAALGCIAAFFLLALLQLPPLSPDTLEAVAPNARAVREQAIGAAVGPAPISFNPHATRVALCRYAAYALAFVLLASIVRTKRALRWAVAVLLAAGLFQVVYALLESFAGGQRVFWVVKQHYTDRFTGTFLNKNHFCGFIEMLVPLAAALVLAVRRPRLPAVRQAWLHRAASVLSAPETHKRIALAVPAVLLGLGVALSLSRSGIICSVVALCALALVAVWGRARRTSALMATLLILITGVAVLVASGPIVRSFESAFSGPMRSMFARLDRLRSATDLVRDFPLTGVGLGALGYVFGSYQSAELGPGAVEYIVNDWAHVACELGLPGLAVVVLGLAVFYAGSLRAAFHRHDRFARWVAFGALLGAFAMLCHSFTDFNLSRTPSNGLLFAALLALAHAAAHAEKYQTGTRHEPGFHTLRLGPLYVRLVFVALAMVPFLVLARYQIDIARADIRFNWYLHCSGEPTDLHFFLPLPKVADDTRKAGIRDLAQAVRLAPRDPVYVFSQGTERMDDVRGRIRSEAELLAAEALPGVRRTEPEGFERLSQLFQSAALERLAANPRSRQQLRRLLVGAETSFRRAIHLAPTVPIYHVALANTLAHRARLESRAPGHPDVATSLREQARQELRRAVRLAPRRPEILLDCARLYVSDALEAGDRKAGLACATGLIRKAVYAAPLKIGPEAYELLETAGVGPNGLIDATPRTLRALRVLCRHLWDQRAWPHLLRALDLLEDTLARARPGLPPPFQTSPDESGGPAEVNNEDSEAMLPRFAWASERAPTVDLQLDVAEKRAAVLALLGRWTQRNRVLERYAKLVDERLEPTLADAADALEAGRHPHAMPLYLDALRQDPLNPEALVGMACVTSVPYCLDLAPEGYDPLSCLFRLVVAADSLHPDRRDRVLHILDRLKPEEERDRRVAEFVAHAAVLLCPGPERPGASDADALRGLHRLAASVDEAVTEWPQRHLIWYFLGVGYEKRGEPEKARQVYESVLGFAPNHRPSLERLASLAEALSEATGAALYHGRLHRLLPEQPARISFGGRVRLLGYTVRAAKDGSKDPPAIQYHWQFLEPLPNGYGPLTQFLDHAWYRIGTDWKGRTPLNRLHPVDLVRCGEVVVETRPLAAVPAHTRYLRMVFLSKDPPAGWPKTLVTDTGSYSVQLRLTRSFAP
jgi:tetratricopeptide (TPR) repeat protein/O-antigen ligase